jgi:predicted dehydrogenase
VTRAAVVGAGGAGAIHADAYSRLEELGVKLVGVCDVVPSKAKDLALKYGAKWYTDVNELLKDCRPDIVTVSTREHQHFEPVIAALEGGANVLCEKILAHKVDLARMMVETAEKRRLTLAVNYNYRHLPTVRWLAQELRSGRLGRARLITCNAHAFGWHHSIDILRYLTGSDPLSVSARLIEKEEERGYPWDYAGEMLYIPSRAATAAWTFPDDVQAVLSSTRGDLKDFVIHDITVVTDRARATIADMTTSNISGRLEVFGVVVPPEHPRCSLADAFHLSIRAVVESLQSGVPPPTSGWDGLAAMMMEAAVVESNASGGAVAVRPRIPP